jgi:hypothetical protein
MALHEPQPLRAQPGEFHQHLVDGSPIRTARVFNGGAQLLDGALQIGKFPSYRHGTPRFLVYAVIYFRLRRFRICRLA